MFIMLYKVILAVSESMNDWILESDNSNESHWAALSCAAVYYAVKGDSCFLSIWITKSFSVIINPLVIINYVFS